jgi:hypothetical protein
VTTTYRRLALGLAAVTAVFAAARTQHSALAQTPAAAFATTSPNVAEVPFGTGEKSTYEVRFGAVRVGSGSLEIVGVESVRGRDAWHTSFTVQGGTFFYRVNDLYESWIDRETLHSLMFIRRIEEGNRRRTQSFDIMPERGIYIQRTRQKTETEKTVAEPLDEAAFLYFVRTIPLRVGETYDFHKYFMPERNPVRIRVLRKERITVPAGTFNAVVVRPIIKTTGIFSEKGQAEVWLSDDESRKLLQIKSRLSFGSLNLYLTSYTPSKDQKDQKAAPARK